MEAQPERRMIGNAVAFLLKISQNEEINKDADFLDIIQKLLDECLTSTLFLPFRNRLVTTFQPTRIFQPTRLLISQIFPNLTPPPPSLSLMRLF